MNLAYESLKERLVMPFVLLGYIVSALLSLITFALVSELEERAVVQILNVEIERFRNRRLVDSKALPTEESLLHVVSLPSALLPNLPKHPPGYTGLERVMSVDKNYTVLIGDVQGNAFALAYDRVYVDARLAKLALFLLLGTGVMTLVSFLIGNRLANRLARPIGHLLRDLTERSGTQTQPGVTERFMADNYPNNEIGDLAKALDAYARRLHGFIERESHFSADVSHELRTPIAAIRGGAEVLLQNPSLPDAFRPRVSAMHRNAVRMSEILEAMLLMARESADGEDLACSLSELLEEIHGDAVERMKGRPVAIALDIRDRPILPIQRSLAYVVISNLLRNACAYTREGHIVVTLQAAGLEIVDSGIGIPEERFATIFKRLEKGEESTGCGLGLSIVARVTELLGWQLEIDSEQHKGTRVTIRFATVSPAPLPA